MNKLYYIFFILLISSCSYLRLNGTLVYEQSFLHKGELIDTSLVLFLTQNPNFMIPDSILERDFRKFDDSLFHKKYEIYITTKKYYENQNKMKPHRFIIYSPKLQYVYYCGLSQIYEPDYCCLNVFNLKKNTILGRALFKEDLSYQERERIKNDFKENIIPKIDSIAKTTIK